MDYVTRISLYYILDINCENMQYFRRVFSIRLLGENVFDQYFEQILNNEILPSLELLWEDSVVSIFQCKVSNIIFL